MDKIITDTPPLSQSINTDFSKIKGVGSITLETPNVASSMMSPITSLFSPSSAPSATAAPSASAAPSVSAPSAPTSSFSLGSPLSALSSVTSPAPSAPAAPTSPLSFETPEIPAESLTSPLSGASMGFDVWTVVRYVVILAVLALLAMNLFTYLDEVTSDNDTLLGRIGQAFRNLTSDAAKGIKVVIKQTANVTAEGTKGVVDLAAQGTKGVVNVAAEGTKGIADVTAGAINSGVNVLDKGLGQDTSSTESAEPQPDTVGDVTQRQGGKSGYCYIGEDRGFRSCVKVGNMDKCMSGNIFPTEAVCINPSLRESSQIK